jgi:hypothetical protein
MSTFNYGAYYQRVQDRKKMQIPRERISWIELRAAGTGL